METQPPEPQFLSMLEANAEASRYFRRLASHLTYWTHLIQIDLSVVPSLTTSLNASLAAYLTPSYSNQ